MRITRGLAALSLVAVVAAACSSGGAATATPAPTPSAAPATASPSAAPPSVAPASPSPTLDACAPANMALKTAGKLTIGADNPAYPPYFEPSDKNPDPWELGDPTNGKGFEGAFGAALAKEMGFSTDTTTWIVTAFNNAIQPGPKDYDIYITQVSYSPERAQAVDLSDGYYDLAQALVVAKGSKLAKVTSIAALVDHTFGAQVGTTSLKTITDVIKPTSEPKVYDTNDAAVEALKNGQIDGLVVDLPTAFYVSGVQLGDGIVVGQFPNSAAGEHFSVALDKDSPLTACVNAAIGRLKAAGTLDALAKQWLPDQVNTPVFQP